MSKTLNSSLLIKEGKSESYRLCSVCGSVGHFSCINHCEDVLCARCTSKHRANVIQQMRELVERLNEYHLKFGQSTSVPANNITQISGAPDRSIHNSANSNSSVITDNSLQLYSKMLNEHLEKDHLLDSKTLADIDARLNERISQLNKNSKSLTIAHNMDASILEPQRSQTAPQTSRTLRSRKITISLNVKKPLRVSVERSFSVGQHPVVVSLIDSYLETVFCRGRDNSVILISLLSIDAYTRGAALTWSIPLSRVLGNVKDKILAGIWCSYIERLILVGRYHFYIFNMDEHRVRCVCECGCGCRNCTGVLPPKIRRNMTPTYRCGSSPHEYVDYGRFIGSNHNGILFYAYKSGRDTYTLESITLKNEPDKEQSLSMSTQTNTSATREMKVIESISINGQLAAICVTFNRVAFVFRRFAQKRISTAPSKDSWETEHYFAFYDHSLKKLLDDAILPSSIRWVTGVVSYGSESRYLLCDPRSQQLLLYQAMEGTLIRRFHIAPINACYLNDGRLVLWIQKAYISSPTGKLHFITPPHLETYAVVSKSFELLKK